MPDVDAELQLMMELYRGYSAYEVAVQNGFTGTVTQWLASLISSEITVNGQAHDNLGNVEVHANQMKLSSEDNTTVKDALEDALATISDTQIDAVLASQTVSGAEFLRVGGLQRFFAGLQTLFVQKTAIANNLTMTAAGSVLDARQGKALSDTVEGKATTQYLSAVLPVAGWSATAPYTQTVTVTGMLAADTPLVDVVLSDTQATAENELEAFGYVSKIVTNDGSVTVTCFADKPTVALNLALKVVK